MNKSYPGYPPRICLDYKVIKNIDTQVERKKRGKTSYVRGFTDHPLTVRSVSVKVKGEKKKTAERKEMTYCVYEKKKKQQG